MNAAFWSDLLLLRGVVLASRGRKHDRRVVVLS